MSAMADLSAALEDVENGCDLDTEQARLVQLYADYLKSEVSATRDAEMDVADRWVDPDTSDGIEWAAESE